jgi:predicted Zn-dependent peptidase
MPAAELDRVRQSYIFDLEYSLDSTYEMGGRYGWGELMKSVRSIEEDQHEARNTTAADISSLASAIFTPANLRLVAVGPWKKGMKKQVRGLIQRYAEQFQSR